MYVSFSLGVGHCEGSSDKVSCCVADIVVGVLRYGKWENEKKFMRHLKNVKPKIRRSSLFYRSVVKVTTSQNWSLSTALHTTRVKACVSQRFLPDFSIQRKNETKVPFFSFIFPTLKWRSFLLVWIDSKGTHRLLCSLFFQGFFIWRNLPWFVSLRWLLARKNRIRPWYRSQIQACYKGDDLKRYDTSSPS